MNHTADIITDEIIFNAGSIDNLYLPKQDNETQQEYEDRIYTEAHLLFMKTAKELGFNTLNNEDEAPYDEVRQDAIECISQILKGLI